MAMFHSQRVYATRFVAPRTKPDQDDFFPVVIKNTRVKRMYQETDKMVDYTIEFEYANNPRPLYLMLRLVLDPENRTDPPTELDTRDVSLQISFASSDLSKSGSAKANTA